MSPSLRHVRQTAPLIKLAVPDEDVTQVILESQIVHVHHIPEIPHTLPGTFARKRRIVRWRASVLGPREYLLRLNGPARVRRLDGGELLAVRRHAALEGVAIVHLVFPVGPLGSFVGGGATVDQEEGVAEEPPNHGGKRGD